MTRATFLALLLCASAVAPARADAKEPAGVTVARAIVKLRAAKLTDRLTRPRYYVMRRAHDVYRVRLRGEVEGAGLKLTLEMHQRSRLSPYTEFVYRLGAAGKLESLQVSLVQVFPPKGSGKAPTELREGFLVRVEGEKLVGHEAQDGKPRGKPFEIPWSDRALPTSFAWFVVPSLFDQGLPAVLEPEVITEEKIRPGRRPEPVRYTCSQETIQRPDGLWVRTLKLSGRKGRDDSTVTVEARGPRAGEVVQVRIDASRVFERVTAKEYARLTREAEREARERKAVAFLRGLSYTQRIYRRNKGRYAATFEQIEALDRRFAGRLAPVRAIYRLGVCVSSDGAKWLAVATPIEQGDRFLAVNQDGKVYRSEAKIPLDGSCAIPPQAKPVE